MVNNFLHKLLNNYILLLCNNFNNNKELLLSDIEKRYYDYDIIKLYLTNYVNEIIFKDILFKINNKGTFGINYICKNIDNNSIEIPDFSAKIQLYNKIAITELKYLQIISDHCIIYKIQHFPILYKNNIILYKNKRYSILFNELATGDLRNFLNNENINSILFKNTIAQLYISLLLLHSLGILHNDSHSGNFLYHKIHEGGCFHYIIDNINFYIPNLGYRWVIWDFGLSKKITKNYDYLKDYNYLLLYLRKNNTEINIKFNKKYKNLKWGYLNENILLDDSSIDIINYLWNYTYSDYLESEYSKKLINEKKWFINLIKNNILYNLNPSENILSSINIIL